MYRSLIDDGVTYYDKDVPTNFISGAHIKNKLRRRLETADNLAKQAMHATKIHEGFSAMTS
jgi:hypothetical protein